MAKKKKSGKDKIPKALREQVWLKCMGKTYEGKCPIIWCSNNVNVYDFQCGHNIPESRGGKTDINNLFVLCSRCNMSMSNTFTIDEWNKMSKLPSPPVTTTTSCCYFF
jgi:5-methylcytosine-specific restriction endonuclease McrA